VALGEFADFILDFWDGSPLTMSRMDLLGMSPSSEAA